MVPCSLRKNELYLTAKRFKKFTFSEFQLFHKERFMSQDETNIDCIENGDEIKIIEQLHGIDFSYYDLYLSKHKNEPMMNIKFKSDTTPKILHFTSNTSIEEMLKIYFCEMYVPENARKDFQVSFNGNILESFDKTTLREKSIQDYDNLLVLGNFNYQPLYYNKNYYIKIEGMVLNVSIEGKNLNISDLIIGTLNTIKNLYDYIKNYSNNIKKIKINGKEYQKDDERTFSSIGIRENFICYVE